MIFQKINLNNRNDSAKHYVNLRSETPCILKYYLLVSSRRDVLVDHNRAVDLELSERHGQKVKK